MKSDVIIIDNQGNGFDKSLDETRKVAAYEDLTHKESLCLQLCAEEMLSLARSITGEMKASFWIETESRTFNLHLTTKTVMDKEKRGLLLAASTSGKNEAAKSFLGPLRDAFEQAMAAPAAVIISERKKIIDLLSVLSAETYRSISGLEQEVLGAYLDGKSYRRA